jgi:hypothetical protein
MNQRERTTKAHRTTLPLVGTEKHGRQHIPGVLAFMTTRPLMFPFLEAPKSTCREKLEAPKNACRLDLEVAIWISRLDLVVAVWNSRAPRASRRVPSLRGFSTGGLPGMFQSYTVYEPALP